MYLIRYSHGSIPAEAQPSAFQSCICKTSPFSKHKRMQMPAPIRAPTWFSRRRLFEQKLADLHKCKDLNQLKQVHALIYKYNLQRDPFVAPKLVSAFSLCRQMALAISVFNQVEYPNVHLYNTLIRAHVQNSQPQKSFEIYSEMQNSGVLPDNFTYLFLLKACSGKDWLELVRMIHAHVEKCSLYSDIFVPNSLIDAYSKCGLMGIRAAKKVYNVMEERDVVTYNSMISGLMKAGELTEARKMFDEMPERDRVSWNTILDGYVKAGDMNVALEMFEKIPLRDVVSWSTLVSGYVKAGDVETARIFFDKMPAKNLITWTIIISGYAEMGLAKEAIGLYDQMEEAGLKPDDGAFVSILSASAGSGLLGLGKRVHKSIVEGNYKCSTSVCNALIDMYAKCGSLNKASNIFDVMIRKDLVSWNVMIHALAMHGHGHKALQFFDRMKQDGFTPDKVTFVAVLSACGHAGLVDEGVSYFYSMERDYRIVLEIEHYGCTIDLLGRGGRLKEALSLVHNMPFEPNVVIWSALLGACRMHNAMGIAEELLNRLVKLESTDAGSCSMLSNIYAMAGNWGSVANARLQMKKTNSLKVSGASSIELNDGFHEFSVMDASHPKSDTIYQTINGLSQNLKKVVSAPLC